MPSILNRNAPVSNNKKFRTVLGLSNLRDDQDNALSLPLPIPKRTKHRPLQAVIFESPQLIHSQLPVRHSDVMANQRPMRHPPVAANQDGPWSVSVAETPNDPRASYSIYIKTPTHHLTLMRNSTEVVDLHNKLQEACPSVSLPTLPVDPTGLPPQKRRSSFLHTLSRLASSSSAGSNKSGLRSPPTSMHQTPMTSPMAEINDPFASPLTEAQSLPSPTSSLGSYLTTIANDPALRATRVWRKFVRVRTDDLESVRVERAIKRVRSDVAVHHTAHAPASPVAAPAPLTPPTSGAPSGSADAAAPEGTEDTAEALSASESNLGVEGIKEEEEHDEQAEDPTPPTEKQPPMSTQTPLATEDQQPAEANEQLLTPSPSPPSPGHHSLRIPRSASADPDKATRLSRVWKASPSPLKPEEKKAPKKSRKVVIDDFEMMRVLGKGCAGKVLLVRHKASSALYALKAITKRHVLAHQELQHTLTEQAVLKRMAHEATDPFVVKLWWSFHDKENLFLVMDFHPGGDLATQLARWGRLGRDRARFYAAEIVEGVEGLHAAGVIYRDLKPENILIGGDGHIVLTDFGLSKEFPRNGSAGPLPTAPSTPTARSSMGSDYYAASSSSSSGASVAPSWMSGSTGALGFQTPNDMTSTFCGTAEYLAPEVIQGLPYSYEVDWWSFGTMLYEMLTGITPFWANNHSDMYVRVLQDELTFPDDRAMDQDTKSLIRGLLQRNPTLRMSEPRIKRHPYFSMIDWSHVYYKRYIPPYIPPIDPSNASDTQNFDDTFLDMEPTVDHDPEPELQTDSEDKDRDERTDGEESVKTPPVQARSPIVDVEEDGPDLFDGYSFKGRNSVIIDDEDEDDGYQAPAEADVPEVPEEEDEEAAPSGGLAAEEHREGMVTPQPAPSPPAPETPTPASATAPAPATAPAATSPVATSSVRAPVPSTVSADDIDPELRNLVTDASFLDEVDTPPPPPPAPPAPVPEKELAKPAAESKILSPIPVQAKTSQHRKWRTERSGVAALDRNLGDILDEDEASATEREDDDWDFIERPGGEDFNGQKSLFARGVVDRYRLAVFRKSSPHTNRSMPRSTSGASAADSEMSEVSPSPTPSEKVRRGRSAGLSLRKTKEFLRARSPAATFSVASSSTTSRSQLSQATPATISGSNTGLLTPSPSVPLGHVLKNKMSTTSVAPSSSSDQSANGAPEAAPPTELETPEKAKPKKLKKGAERVFSLFGSPRQ